MSAWIDVGSTSVSSVSRGDLQRVWRTVVH
jgi:hypothetical protein